LREPPVEERGKASSKDGCHRRKMTWEEGLRKGAKMLETLAEKGRERACFRKKAR